MSLGGLEVHPLLSSFDIASPRVNMTSRSDCSGGLLQKHIREEYALCSLGLSTRTASKQPTVGGFRLEALEIGGCETGRGREKQCAPTDPHWQATNVFHICPKLCRERVSLQVEEGPFGGIVGAFGPKLNLPASSAHGPEPSFQLPWQNYVQ